MNQFASRKVKKTLQKLTKADQELEEAYQRWMKTIQKLREASLELEKARQEQEELKEEENGQNEAGSSKVG